MVTRAGWVGLAASLAVISACEQFPHAGADLPVPPHALEVIKERSHFRPRTDVVDVGQAAPSRLQRFANSVNVGDVKVIEGDDSVVSTVRLQDGTTGYGLRMDQSRQDLPRITQQIIGEEGDHFDFVVVFPAFEDLMNPGFAYYNPIRSTESGIGEEAMDMSEYFGSAGRLQGFLNMNHPSAYTQVDGREISDPESSAFPIMGQELTHRWLAFAGFKKADYNGGNTSFDTLGRDDAHWSALMHTGPADMSTGVSVSVQDGVAWRDNQNGTFTVAEVFSDRGFNISSRSRFSDLDLYLMGLYSPQEVEPFYIIENAKYGAQALARDDVLQRGLTITGQRVDITIDDVIAAMGPRIPSSVDSQKDFNIAIVVLTAPGQSAADVSSVVSQVQSFRTQWEQKFTEWTSGRASVCTALGGNCATARLKAGPVEMVESVQDGSILPGELVTVNVTVQNTGSALSVPSVVRVTSGNATVSPAERAVGPLEPGASVVVSFEAVPGAQLACGDELNVSVELAVEGTRPAAFSVTEALGVRQVFRDSLEAEDGWVLDPTGQDTAQKGRWARGVPRLVDLRRFGASEVIIQPAADTTGDGTQAFITDPGTETLSPNSVGETDVDDGVTTLESPAMSLRGLIDPVLRWQSFHTALVLDLDRGELRDGVDDDLVALVSTNGTDWVEVDRDASNDFAWKAKEVRLRGVEGLALEGAESLKVRFVVGDLGPEQNIVEAGIDDVLITDIAPACAPGGGGGGGAEENKGGGSDAPAPAQGCACAVPADLGGPWLALAGVLGLLVARRKR